MHGQQKGIIDYNEILAPTSRMSIVRCVVTLAVHFGKRIHELDIKSTFLMETCIRRFMYQPWEFEINGKGKLVCKLKYDWHGNITSLFRHLVSLER